jgi:hypothetical protein
MFTLLQDLAGVENVGGKTYRIDTGVFLPQDVAAETTVVDGLGQKLTLNIENIRGGGGQRRIAIFCPFWVVNTTEHSLRYKQEKSNLFVSGTVSSPSRDGSLALSGGRVQDHHEPLDDSDIREAPPFERPANSTTVFSGRAGALATTPGICELSPEQVASLIETDLSIDKLGSLAFMFNFNEGSLSIGNQKMCVQLWDGTGITRYASDWSSGFSLDSVGFSQVIR